MSHEKGLDRAQMLCYSPLLSSYLSLQSPPPLPLFSPTTTPHPSSQFVLLSTRAYCPLPEQPTSCEAIRSDIRNTQTSWNHGMEILRITGNHHIAVAFNPIMWILQPNLPDPDNCSMHYYP